MIYFIDELLTKIMIIIIYKKCCQVNNYWKKYKKLVYSILNWLFVSFKEEKRNILKHKKLLDELNKCFSEIGASGGQTIWSLS